MRIDALLWLVSLLCLVGLGDVLAREPYVDFQFRSQTQNRLGLQQDHYRWRPLNEEEEKLIESSADSANIRLPNQSTLNPSSVIDYAETPPGLPRGVYRPVEERHTITPHMDGFRFRELTPDEQLRIKRRNELYNQSWQPDRSDNRSIHSSGGYSHGQPEIQRQGAYKFRPDKRLDKKRGGNWGHSQSFPYNPAFTDAYQAPMFRPE
ncbi:MAG: hypothetical protein KUF75_16765 [Candidatus Thiodiazotropha sp. (ex Ctena orbiculata)]|nr:hypothetical protein [Candidatus Thiodiazotropha taylori]